MVVTFVVHFEPDVIKAAVNYTRYRPMLLKFAYQPERLPEGVIYPGYSAD